MLPKVPTSRLTVSSVERLKPPPTGQIDIFDQVLPGFGLRLSYAGSKSFFVMTRVHGTLIRMTIGRYPALSLADAREKARCAIRTASEGKDPREERRLEEQRRTRERRNTYEALVEEFLQRHVGDRLRESTAKEYRRVLAGPPTRSWHGRPVSQITRRDVRELIDGIGDRGNPGAANLTFAYLRKFFNWCVDRDVIDASPVDRMRVPHVLRSRDRVLDEQEIGWVYRAFAEEPGIFGPLSRLLFLTGQRRSDVAGMRWDLIRNLYGSDPVWELRSRETKNALPHLVPLVAAAAAIVRAMPRTADLVFTTTGTTPVSGFSHFDDRIDARITQSRAEVGLPPLPHWTLHDLRRTMVTVMNEVLEVPPHIVEAIVNHVSGSARRGVAGVYNRALYLPQRRRALVSWADYLLQRANGSA